MTFNAIIIAGVFGLCGCATKVLPPVPDARMAQTRQIPVETLQRGHQVYLKHCGRCHEYMMPDEVTSRDWHVVVPGMAWNAGISAAEEEAVLKYVTAARQP